MPILTVHARLSVNSMCSIGQSLGDDIALWRSLGIDHVGLIAPKLEAVGWPQAPRVVADAGLRVSNVATPFALLDDTLVAATQMGATVVYTSHTGRPGLWDETAPAFSARIAPHRRRAEALGARLCIEPTNPFRSDLSFVFCFRDALDLARDSGLGVVLDVSSCWLERDLGRLVRENLDMIALVQIGDYALGTFDTPNRVPVGDGAIPIERLLALLLDAGYEGTFDLEVLGPRVEEEGYPSALARSVERATEILLRLGV